jgi:hypothetical protein
MKKIYVLKNVARHRYLKEHPEDILLLPKMKAADGSYVYFDTITGDSYDAEGKKVQDPFGWNAPVETRFDNIEYYEHSQFIKDPWADYETKASTEK